MSSSIASSSCSSVVSFRGDQGDLRETVDTIFTELRDSLSVCQLRCREISQMVSEEKEYKECLTQSYVIADYVEELDDLFLELSGVIKQVVGNPKGTEEKEIYKQMKEERKLKKQQEKERMKAEADAEKLATKNDALNSFMRKQHAL